MTKTNTGLRSYTLPQLRGALSNRTGLLRAAQEAVREVEAEMRRRANAKVRAKQAKTGTKRIQASSLRVGMDLKVPGGYQKIKNIYSGLPVRPTYRRLVLANGKIRTVRLRQLVTVKA